MRHVFANFAILFGSLGFAAYLFIIIAGFFGCCAGLTSLFYHKLVLFILALAVVAFLLCMVNNCCIVRQR
jgi:hypothetical protein